MSAREQLAEVRLSIWAQSGGLVEVKLGDIAPEWLIDQLAQRGVRVPEDRAGDVEKFRALLGEALFRHGDWVIERRRAPGDAERLATAAQNAENAVMAAYETAVRG